MLKSVHHPPNLCRGGNLPPAINFYRQGKWVDNAVLTVYDAAGNAISKININDNINRCGRDAMHCVSTLTDAEPRRAVGSWDLTDTRGRPVSPGTYLVKGVVSAGGRKERVSIIVGVR